MVQWVLCIALYTVNQRNVPTLLVHYICTCMCNLKVTYHNGQKIYTRWSGAQTVSGYKSTSRLSRLDCAILSWDLLINKCQSMFHSAGSTVLMSINRVNKDLEFHVVSLLTRTHTTHGGRQFYTTYNDNVWWQNIIKFSKVFL